MPGAGGVSSLDTAATATFAACCYVLLLPFMVLVGQLHGSQTLLLLLERLRSQWVACKNAPTHNTAFTKFVAPKQG